MKLIHRRNLAVGFASLLYPLVSFASKLDRWQISKTKSIIQFSHQENTVKTEGQFKNFNGEIKFDEANLKECEVKILIDLDSLDTLPPKLLTPQVLLQHKFAYLHAYQFSKVSRDTFDAHGQILIKHKAWPIKVTFKLSKINASQAVLKGNVQLKKLSNQSLMLMLNLSKNYH